MLLTLTIQLSRKKVSLILLLSLPRKHYDVDDKPLYSLSSVIVFCAGVYVLNKKQFVKDYEGLNTVNIKHLDYY